VNALQRSATPHMESTVIESSDMAVQKETRRERGCLFRPFVQNHKSPFKVSIFLFFSESDNLATNSPPL
jgi:hypothetical protein